ncbi:MAG: transporter related [Caulobacteraceae bacterium]|nr:transporter related [Caulobacteraceae bacterium]
MAEGGGLRVEGLKSALAGPFTLEVARGAVLAISGASGAGKSLFLRMVADLDPNEGEVGLNGVSRASLPANQWRRRIPYVAAESGWWAQTVHDHFAPNQLDRARSLAERLGVGAAPFDGPVDRLSTGERQRLALVRAFILDPPGLLLDEPTGPLDPVSVQKVEVFLQERLAAGTAIVLVSHDPAQGARLGARRMRMVDRKLQPEATA